MTDAAPRPPEPAETSAPRNILAVASGKGGVGKTWLSITLSHALAKRGHNILLFDSDFGLANVDVQLGLAPRQDLGGVLARRIGLSDAVHAYPEGGFDLVAGRSGSGNLASLSADRLSRFTSHLTAFAPAHDRVVLDIGARDRGPARRRHRGSRRQGVGAASHRVGNPCPCDQGVRDPGPGGHTADPHPGRAPARSRDQSPGRPDPLNRQQPPPSDKACRRRPYVERRGGRRHTTDRPRPGRSILRRSVRRLARPPGRQAWAGGARGAVAAGAMKDRRRRASSSRWNYRAWATFSSTAWFETNSSISSLGPEHP